MTLCHHNQAAGGAVPGQNTTANGACHTQLMVSDIRKSGDSRNHCATRQVITVTSVTT